MASACAGPTYPGACRTEHASGVTYATWSQPFTYRKEMSLCVPGRRLCSSRRVGAEFRPPREFLSTAPSDERWAVELWDPFWLNDETYECCAATVPRCASMTSRPATLGIDHRLGLRPVPWTERHRTPLPRPVRRRKAVLDARTTVFLACSRYRCLRLLQQRRLGLRSPTRLAARRPVRHPACGMIE
jgi:hypothetical protein